MIDFEILNLHWKNITLNEKTVQLITSNELKQIITNYLFQHFNIKMSCSNKHFVHFDPSVDLEILKQTKHLVYINTNQRIYLLLLIRFKSINTCVLIDKQNNLFYLLKCQFSPSLYQGTVFEGEVIDSYFMISDFLVYLDKDISHYPFDQRLKLLKSIISAQNYHYDPILDPFQIIIKDFIDYCYLLSFVKEYLPTLPYYHKIIGLIFRPNQNSIKNIIYNFNHKYTFQKVENDSVQQISDQKPVINAQLHPEVKFLLFDTGNPDDYLLKLIDNRGQLIDYDYALVNDMKTSRYLQDLIEKQSQTIKNHGVCVLCRYNSKFNKWKPIQYLNDHQPDNISQLI